MKTLILLTTLAALSFPAFAQIDDVINKPKESKPKNTQPSMFTSLLKLFSSVELTTLMDDIRKDGVQESKFYAVFGVSGQIVKVFGPDADYDSNEKNLKILPFTIKMGTDESLYLVTSAIGMDNMFEKTITSDSKIPVKKLDFVVFKLDKNMSFRDIKSIGWRLVDVDLAFPIVGYSNTRYISFEIGGELGGEREEIKLDDGETVIIGPGKGLGTVNGDYECMSSNCKTGSVFALRAGLELREQVGAKGYIQLSGKMEWKTVRGGSKETATDYIHSSLMIKPSLSYTRSISKTGKTTMTFGVSANLSAFNKLNFYEGGYDSEYRNTSTRTVDLSDRNRQPYQAKLIINF